MTVAAEKCADLAARSPSSCRSSDSRSSLRAQRSNLAKRRGPLPAVEQGAEAILNLAVSLALAGRSGLYFSGLREARAHAQAYDVEAAACAGSLWS
jgi:hypothetical protein